jgi:hypothetical protein
LFERTAHPAAGAAGSAGHRSGSDEAAGFVGKGEEGGDLSDRERGEGGARPQLKDGEDGALFHLRGEPQPDFLDHILRGMGITEQPSDKRAKRCRLRMNAATAC